MSKTTQDLLNIRYSQTLKPHMTWNFRPLCYFLLQSKGKIHPFLFDGMFIPKTSQNFQCFNLKREAEHARHSSRNENMQNRACDVKCLCIFIKERERSSADIMPGKRRHRHCLKKGTSKWVEFFFIWGLYLVLTYTISPCSSNNSSRKKLSAHPRGQSKKMCQT